MKTQIIATVLFALVLGKVSAQSQTFKIENISKPEKMLFAVPPTSLYNGVDKDFVKLSVKENLVNLSTHPVIEGYLKAYQNHYPLTISPDIAWVLICQGFANHVNANPEKLRTKLVGFEGKKTLSVKRNATEADLPNLDWEAIFPEFTTQIADFTGKDLISSLTANFTTTTIDSKIVSQITIMESVKEFFIYKVTIRGCGISEVTVEGSTADWEKILTKLDYLAKYDLEWWTSELKPVIQKIIDTKKGKLDKQFWMNIVKYHKLGVYGSMDGIDGWMLKFYPYHSYNQDGVKLLTRSKFKEIKSLNILPKEIVNVPFILEVRNDSGDLTAEYNMEFWAGFMGVKQDPTTYNVKPEIGWAVNRKGEIPLK
ncbi:MAG: DUF4419 domain-containing protein [Pedobacter sp.]|nr:MAG: DUF4419 domain-containing protein [Pedobacter sp.]